MSGTVTAATLVAGVAGDPVGHSLSPLIHNAWIAAAKLDAVYIAVRPGTAGFAALASALRGGVFRGLNVTAPFKAEALAAADRASGRARRSGAANLLLFDRGGEIIADNTDGEGLLAALAQGAPGFDPAAGPAVILGAGGAARGAAAALLHAGAPEIQLVNRSLERARALAQDLGPTVTSLSPDAAPSAIARAKVIINATPAAPDIPLDAAGPGAVVMDMVYRPLVTSFLARANALGLVTVDGLAMLIGQAKPSFTALFETPVPEIDVRGVALAALSEGS